MVAGFAPCYAARMSPARVPEDPRYHGPSLLVLADGRPGGVLTRSVLLDGLAQSGRQAHVADFQSADIASVDASAPLLPAMTRLRSGEAPCLQVVEAGQPVGLLTLENIGEFLMVRAALGGAESGPRKAPTGAGVV